ncbi:hypothetical protein DPMN_176584, partial [Dreissena polymorpha]
KVNMPNAYIGGIACRFPKARNTKEFWDGLISGQDMTDKPRWPAGLYKLPPRLGLLQDINKFDNSYFGIPDEEVELMNPLLWHLLEILYECVVDSCLPLAALQDSTVGLYLGCGDSDMEALLRTRVCETENLTCTQYILSYLANCLGVQGPAITVDTGDSCSLAALQMATVDLDAGKCQYAIVAGCSLILNPIKSLQMGGFLSKDGRSHIFDQSGEGIVRAEGCAAILLARCVDELPRIYCNIVDMGIAFRSPFKDSLKDMSTVKMAEMLEDLYGSNNITADDIAYVELHGYGVRVKDDLEIKVIAEVLGEKRTDKPLPVGCVKTNIGSAEAVSGFASIIKCILAMHYKEIPPNHLKTSSILTETLQTLGDEVIPLCEPRPLKGKYMGVSCVGQGGVCGHVILEPFYPDDDDSFCQVPGDIAIPFTACNVEGVEAITSFVENNRYNINLLKLMTSSCLSSDPNHPIRGFIQLGTREEDFHVWQRYANEIPTPVYLCLDDILQGPFSVSIDLMEIDTFTAAFNQCSKSLNLIEPSIDLEKLIVESEMIDPFSRIGLLVSSLLYMCMIDCLEEAGTEFSGVMGCGVSEVIAAYIDGCVSRDQCFQIMNTIGKHLEEYRHANEDSWCVLDVSLPLEDLYQLGPRALFCGSYDIEQSRLAVQTQFLDKLIERIDDVGGACGDKIDGGVPVYTSCMQGLVRSIERELRDIIPSPQYSSKHLFSGSVDWRDHASARQCLVDPAYIAGLITKPCMRYRALLNMMEKGEALTITNRHYMDGAESGSFLENPRKGLSYHETSLKCGLDDTVNTSLYDDKSHDWSLRQTGVVPDLVCKPSVSSLAWDDATWQKAIRRRTLQHQSPGIGQDGDRTVLSQLDSRSTYDHMTTPVSRSLPDGIGQGHRPMPDHLSAAIRLLPGHDMTGTSPGTGPVFGDRSSHRSMAPVTGDRSGHRHLGRQLVPTIAVDVVHALLYRTVLIQGVNKIVTDHLETLGDVILRDVIPIAAVLFLGIAGIKPVVMLYSFVYIRYGGHLGFLDLVDPGRFALVGRSIIGRVDRVLNRPRMISFLLESFRYEFSQYGTSHQDFFSVEGYKTQFQRTKMINFMLL